MLHSARHLLGYRILATDEHIGTVDDLFFDDEKWTIRYLVVDTGDWLPGRRVLIAQSALGRPDETRKTFPVSLTRQQVKNSPDIDTHRPVSRQQELELHRYYMWTPYWGTMGGVYPVSGAESLATPLRDRPGPDIDKGAEPHLRGMREVAGYGVAATDGHIGHVEDFIVDNGDWVIRYLVLDTRSWLPGKNVLISPEWVEDVNWAENRLSVSLHKKDIEQGPEYDPSRLNDRDYEQSIFEHYRRQGYWHQRRAS